MGYGFVVSMSINTNAQKNLFCYNLFNSCDTNFMKQIKTLKSTARPVE